MQLNTQMGALLPVQKSLRTAMCAANMYYTVCWRAYPAWVQKLERPHDGLRPVTRARKLHTLEHVSGVVLQQHWNTHCCKQSADRGQCAASKQRINHSSPCMSPWPPAMGTTHARVAVLNTQRGLLACSESAILVRSVSATDSRCMTYKGEITPKAVVPCACLLVLVWKCLLKCLQAPVMCFHLVLAQHHWHAAEDEAGRNNLPEAAVIICQQHTAERESS